jgi:hypothetical protein
VSGSPRPVAANSACPNCDVFRARAGWRIGFLCNTPGKYGEVLMTAASSNTPAGLSRCVCGLRVPRGSFGSPGRGLGQFPARVIGSRRQRYARPAARRSTAARRSANGWQIAGGRLRPARQRHAESGQQRSRADGRTRRAASLFPDPCGGPYGPRSFPAIMKRARKRASFGEGRQGVGDCRFCRISVGPLQSRG